ncbi:hypothetical protein F8388_016893 [Cannabis sativa]|uniref:RNase H type-1 domain-containing protein n=1 Tax=Cannabis sativa TaxID=3483 RepID=A0A7J6ERM0_CANSA|nr:hypothetical protein F8388_016893 [Cannabis sativa]
MQLISKHDFPLFDYNEAQQNNRVGHSVLASNQLTHYSQLFSVDDFHEDSPALFVDAALDHKHGLTGIGFIFKIGHHQIIASENRLLPGASTPIFAEVSKVNGDWQDHSALSGLVSQIRLFFSNFPDASLKYLPRQFNTAAHSLAKDAIRLRLGYDSRVQVQVSGPDWGPGPGPGFGFGSGSQVPVWVLGPESRSGSGFGSRVQGSGSGPESRSGSRSETGFRVWVPVRSESRSRILGPSLGSGFGSGSRVPI